MKVRILVFTLALIIPLFVLSQDDVTDIFDDLSEFEPAPAAQPATPQPVAKPTISMPQPAPAQTVLPMPASQTPIIYTMESGGAPVIEKTPSTPLDIEKTIALGKEAYGDDDWSRAEGLFEAVLKADPLNKEAIRWLKRITGKKMKIETKSYGTTRERMLENVQAAWNTPKAEGEPPESTETVREPTEAEQRIDALQIKLETIRFPAISFQNADIQQVVLELSALCRKFDGKGKGVNLVVFGTAETLLPPVTFSGTDLSALETLDIITQMSGMKYDIGPNMVSLTPVNYEPPQQMVSAEFDVGASVGGKMALMTGEPRGGSGLMDVRPFFSTIPFPPGSSVQYNPEFNLLLVRNVPKHINRVSALLERYNQKALEERSRQVEIETKFIEVAEGALEELGFEWTLSPGEAYVNDDRWALAGDQKLFTDTLRTGQEAFGSTVEPANRASVFNALAGAIPDPTGTGLIGEAGTVLVQKIGGDRVDVLIKALERSAGSDLLSAPKILTKSGETARIHVGEVHWFPTAYDVVIERYAQPSLLPLDYEEERTGVMLEVTPQLDPENGTINLELAPEIRELAGFDEQHVSTMFNTTEKDLTLALGSDNVSEDVGFAWVDYLIGSDKNQNVYNDRLIARRPVFKSRKVETVVTIEDGSTIAMGGLIKERLETFKDSVPILGKIPLLGRLFRSEGERTTKRNLMIFVTANQVDATGHKKYVE